MSNVRQLMDHGVPVYPITDRSLVLGLQDNAFATYVMAWDGASTPVVAQIPAGVVVTYNGTNYTGTLAASSSTAQDLYLVASGTQQGEYDRYITTHTGSTYAWNQVGSTAIVSPVIADDLVTNDASKALSAKQGKVLGDKTSELEAKVDKSRIAFNLDSSIATGQVIGATIALTPYSYAGWDSALVRCSSGDKFTITGLGGNNARLWAFTDGSGKVLALSEGGASATDVTIVAPDTAAYCIINTQHSAAGPCYFTKKDSISNLLENKVDKEQGKSLIDEDVADAFALENNSEWLSVTADQENKILEGRASNGRKVENVGLDTKDVSIGGNVTSSMESELVELKTDSDGKILSYRDKNGLLHELAGIETEKLILTKDGMTEFKKMLIDNGFTPGGVGDFSDKKSTEMPEPRLGHLNIISNFDLTSITRTSDVPVEIEFYDGSGNYFRKYAIINGQGRSSMYFIKKGLSIDLFNENPEADDFDDDNTFSVKFGDWVAQDSFHCKSYYTDYFRATGAVVYKLADEVLKTRGVMDDRPYKRYYTEETETDGSVKIGLKESMPSGAKTVPAGFPVIVYQNGAFWGVNSFQLKKHRDNYQMKKSNKNHILLDCGESWIGFISANGNINWEAIGNEVNGVEIRNPKDLYCMNGKKYKAETNQGELVDIVTAESWINAGVTPRGEVVDAKLASNLLMTASVRESMENLTKYSTEINALISGGATTETIREAVSERFDVKSLIDYILLVEVTNNTDCYANNIIVSTWGKPGDSNKMLWSINLYDCDVTFGTFWMGTFASSPSNHYVFSNGYYPYRYIFNYFQTELKARYKELRDSGIFTAEHITNLFRSWMERVGYDYYEKEYDKWNESPCFREGGCNDGWERISNDYISREWSETVEYQLDAVVLYNYKVYKSIANNNIGNNPETETSYWEKISWDSSKPYANGDICYYGKWTYYPFRATAPTTNVKPLKKLYDLYPFELGFYGSLWRIYKFMVEELQNLDSQMNY